MKNFVRNINNFNFNASAVIGENCFKGNWAMIKGADKDDRKGVGLRS